ncbi:hypothetical protein HYH03_012376 [Edaphochlamys debaryana]|uniref:Nuclear pore complex protein Nup85 n=1 Tax=Edaphochlamys debaryana TaxID=47281 RepID=A0A835XT11_9CHLO|nr:hypothetical protein HYH03_012376 [Edaphochlamys debaryana]|eukprot:KAG2489150.1 hypothetical protein HYH03_012376 [Edaphochlamys debaryana]
MADGPTFTVPVSHGSRLHFSWGLGSELRLLDTQDPSTQEGGGGGFASYAVWGQVSSSNRIIAFGTMEQYADMQRARLAGSSDDAYLTRVAAYARHVRDQLMKLRDDDEDGGLSQLEAALWALLEVFCVDLPRNEGNLGEDFVLWLAAHHDALAALTMQPTLGGRIQELRASPAPDAQPDYWPVLRRLVALGLTGEALGLLDEHGARRAAAGAGAGGGAAALAALQQPGLRAQLELLDCLHVLLKRLPRLAPSGRRDPTSRAYASLAEYAQARAVWLREAADIAGAEHLFAAAAAANRRTAEGVRSVLAVLLGEPSALRGATQDWLEAAAAEVVHRGGGGGGSGGSGGGGVVSANQLRALLAEAQAARGGEGGSGLLELLAELLGALCEGDVAGVVSALCNSGAASAWLLAHCLELLAAGAAAGGPGGAGGAGLLGRRLAVSGCDQMEYFRLAWAESLLPGLRGGGWALALAYLAWCPQHGAAAAEALMEAMPVDSRDVRSLEKALAACRRLGLGPSAAVMCRVAGVDALSRGSLGGGAQWMVRAADPRRSAACLALAGAAAEEALLGRLGVYRAGPLALPGGEGLAELLEWMPGGGGGAGSEGGASGGGGGEAAAGGGLAALLGGLLRLSRAMGALGAARDANAGPDDPSALTALASARSALLALVRTRTAPRRLCLPLLSYALPLLEATAGGGRCLSSADLRDLAAWAAECAGGAAVGGLGLGLGAGMGGGGAAGGLAAAAAALGVSERYGRDVALALVRAVARAHVMEHSGPAAGGQGAGAGAGLAP